MLLSRVRSLLVVVFAATVVAAAGCGERALSSPAGPSALSDAATIASDPSPEGLASTTDDALAARSGKGSDRGRSKDSDRQDRNRRGRDRDGDYEDDDEKDDEVDDDDEEGDRKGRRRNLSGFVMAVGADSITVRNVVVTVTPTTVIRHGNRRLTLAQIAIGDHVQVKGAMSADGTMFAASEVKVEDTGRDNDDADEDEDDEDDVEVKGAVAGLPATPSCPMLTFMIGTMTVKTNERTKFDGVTCATLANGQMVEVEGVKQADGSLLAKEVELEDSPSEVKGRISGLPSTTGCPNLTFTVGTTTVTTSSATVFDGVACAALANGRRVEVEGTLTGTTFAATKVELD